MATAREWTLDADYSAAYRAEWERVVHAIVRYSSEVPQSHARLLEALERAVIDVAAADRASPFGMITDQQDRDVLVINATIQIRQLLAGVDIDRSMRFFRKRHAEAALTLRV